MATVFKRPSSRFWNACYRDREGHLKRPSTKLTDKAAALRLATEWEKVERMAKECHSTATTPPAARQTTLIENEIWQNESSALCSAALLQRHGRIALRQVLAFRQELAAENRDFQQEQAA
jgi:hypothetical protein